MFKDSQNEFIKLIGETILDKSLNDATRTLYYSMIADATPDSKSQEMLSIFMGYVDENLILIERLISIKERVGKTGKLSGKR